MSRWLLLLAFVIIPAQAAELRPFVTDGCTLFPEGTRREPQLWEICCYEHDLRFWAGGSKQNRNRADTRLRECVKDMGAELTADLMYIGVRLGRLSPVKLPAKTWGNAWKRPGYRKFTYEDLDRVKKSLPQYRVPYDIELRFLEDLSADL